jgi:hypothetical protein
VSGKLQQAELRASCPAFPNTSRPSKSVSFARDTRYPNDTTGTSHVSTINNQESLIENGDNSVKMGRDRSPSPLDPGFREFPDCSGI